MALSNRMAYALFILCIGAPFLTQADGINPALKLKIINRSDKLLTLAFVHHTPEVPDSEKNIQSGRTFYTKLDANTLRAICTRTDRPTRTIITGWYNRAVQGNSDYCNCLDIAPLLQQRDNKKLLEVTYHKAFCYPNPIWKY